MVLYDMYLIVIRESCTSNAETRRYAPGSLIFCFFIRGTRFILFFWISTPAPHLSGKSRRDEAERRFAREALTYWSHVSLNRDTTLARGTLASLSREQRQASAARGALLRWEESPQLEAC